MGRKSLRFKIMLMSIVITGMTASTINAGTVTELPSARDIKAVTGKSANMYSTEEIYDRISLQRQLESFKAALDGQATEGGTLIIPQNQVLIEGIGGSAFVDAIWIQDGIYTNISNVVAWSSKDAGLLHADQGRLLAIGEGETEVTASFRGASSSITVTIKHYEASDRAQQSVFNASSSRQEAKRIAEEMINLEWTPTKQLYGWHNINADGGWGKEYIFPANVTQRGIPYTMSLFQCDAEEFMAKLNAGDDFYKPYPDSVHDRDMARYGNDCSAFVSYALGIWDTDYSWHNVRKNTTFYMNGVKNGTFQKVGSYNAESPDKHDLMASYSKLQTADALVKPGHIIMVNYIDDNVQKVYGLEQTPDRAQYTSWDYQSLADGSYRPFTYFE